MKQLYCFLTGLLLCAALPLQAQIMVKKEDPKDCKGSKGKAIIFVNDLPKLEPEFALQGRGYQESNTFSDLPPGDYVAMVRDKVTKCVFTKEFTIKEPSGPMVHISATGNRDFCQGAPPPEVLLKAEASMGSGKYQYSWPGGELTVSASGNYAVTVTDIETGCKTEADTRVEIMGIVCSADPNDIVGPESYGSRNMIAKSKTHNYMVRFENDPVFATAPAQIVKIRHPLDKNVDIFSLRLGRFGFGGMNFDVPAGQVYYTTRVDVRDSLDVVVDVIAGIDVTKREAFWIFEAKDAATGLPPANAQHGFLPVNDAAGKGEGYVTYTVKAAEHTVTGDSIHALASIIFDDNAAIATPPIYNIIDAAPPVSRVTALPVSGEPAIRVKWSGEDDANGSGVRDYTLYVSKNDGAFELVQSGIKTNELLYEGTPGMKYAFFTRATDNTGNEEAMKSAPEATTTACGVEICNGVDDDCDGQIDEGLETKTYYQDLDADGYGSAKDTVACSGVVPPGYATRTGDCNDQNPDVHPDAAETCNGRDDNCDGGIDEGCELSTWYRDRDGDGYGNTQETLQAGAQLPGYVATSGDCDDSNASIHPGVTETANGVDDDCDGETDEDFPQYTFYLDNDGDGYGSPDMSVRATVQPARYVTNTGDCNDNDPAVYPGAIETENGKDDNCNGLTDEGFAQRVFYRDFDGDNFGIESDTVHAVYPPLRYASVAGDCNDRDWKVYPGATELPNGIDDNCNGQIDEGLEPASKYYRDKDGDNYGFTEDSIRAHTPPAGYVDRDGDCDDNNASIHPGAAEQPNGIDDNCNGQIDEGLPPAPKYYRDKDGDTYGRSDDFVQTYNPPAGYVVRDGDCNDDNADVHPGATELPNGIDDNCNGQIDEGLPPAPKYYRDKDGDTYGRSDDFVQTYNPPAGYVVRDGDCNDDNAAIHPGAAELPNGIDDNCDGRIDEGLPLTTFYRDADNDGYGVTERPVLASSKPNGYAALPGDCNDANVAIHPGAAETANGIDDNCNGQIDEGFVMRVYYRDGDNDGYGMDSRAILAVERPAGYSDKGGDCNDRDAAIYPGATEVPNGKDDNCDGRIDENTGDDGRGLTVTAAPIPSDTEFKVTFRSKGSDLPIRIRILDNRGNVVEHKQGIIPGQTILIGRTYRPGYYYLEAVQGKQKNVTRLVKL